ncbi:MULTISPECIES: hypothetical protein [Bacillaceae]|nr:MULTISPECIES: hypothetical protein [Bacillaceae]
MSFLTAQNINHTHTSIFKKLAILALEDIIFSIEEGEFIFFSA